MAYPTIVSPTVPFPLNDAPQLTSPIPSSYASGQTFTVSSVTGWFEVNAAGSFTNNPIGQSGPFAVIIDAEEILCSEVTPEGVVTVWTAGASNGRAYNSTSAVAHGDTNTQVYLIGTSAQDAPAPLASPTFTGIVTAPAIHESVSAITAVANAATVPVTASNVKVTNNSAATLTITMAVTSAVDGAVTTVRVYDFSAVAQTVAWTNTENSTVSAPTTSNGSTTLPLTAQFQFNGATSKWRTILSA